MRTNGFEKPFSKDQVTSWVLQPLIMSCFIAFVAKLLDRDKCLAILIPNAVLVLIVLASWTICESRNSAEPKKASSLSCLRVPSKPTRYCTICCKNSPGLDHHCTWLNTCIGENNYEAFYCLVVAAAMQTLGQAVIGILMATLWFDDVKAAARDDWHDPLRVLLWVHNAICLSLANSYFLLAGFHTYLLWIGSGTYDFILANGSDGLCARLLKCKCLRHSANKKSKLSHVVSAESKSGGDGVKASVRRSKDPPPQTTAALDDAMRVAAAKAAADKKQQDIAQWKAEWAQKYGADEDDDNNDSNAASAGVTVKQPAPVTSKVDLEMSAGPPKLLLAGGGDKVSARRTSTYPVELVGGASSSTSCVGESQANMSRSINRSEDIFEEVDLVELERRSAAGDIEPTGPKTDL